MEPQVKDAQTIETETQTTISEFSKLKQEFDKVNNAVTEQEPQTDAINLIDDILYKDNPFGNIDTDDLLITISYLMITIQKLLRTFRKK